MILDPTPEGYLSLVEAYQLHSRHRHDISPDAIRDELVNAFAERSIEAFVRYPGQTENLRIPPDSWRRQFFADRVFLAEAIVAGHDTPWAQFFGRTPFVREAEFCTWSATKNASALDELTKRMDPMKAPIWSLPMAVAWIGSRTADAVRAQWTEYLQLRDGPDAKSSLSLMFGGGEHEDALFGAAQRGDIQISGIDQETGDAVTVPIEEWGHLELAADANFAERLDQKDSGGRRVRYRNLSVRSDQIQSAWRRSEKRFATSALITFEDSEYYTLYEASLWVGCKGHARSSSFIEEHSLDDFGFQALRSKLADGILTATGVNQRTLRREAIPHDYWEMAGFPSGPDDRLHSVSFIDPSLADSGGMGGVLFPYREQSGWEKIRVDRSALQEVFDFKSVKPAAKIKTKYPQPDVDGALARWRALWLNEKAPSPTFRRWVEEIAPELFEAIATTATHAAWKTVITDQKKGLKGRSRKGDNIEMPNETLLSIIKPV